MITIEQQLEQLFPDMVKRRRFLHQHPEVSYQEKETSAYVAKCLEELGIPVKRGERGYSVVGELKGAHPGPTVALRADMDALPIQDAKSVDYASKVPGVMHACGHDAHTTTLLAIAEVLSGRKDELKGTIRFLFQPAEEISPGGAAPLIAEGAMEGVDAVYGVHLWAPLPTGEAQTKSGAFMAAADEFFIDVKGKGGHGGLPHQTIDSVLVGSQIVVNLQSIVSRHMDPTEPCVVTVGSIHAGSSFNVIAETCSLNGTVRTFSIEARDRIREQMKTIAEQTGAMYGAQVDFRYKVGYPPVVNDEKETDRFFKVGVSVFGEKQVSKSPFIMAAEDFAYYLERVPGCFVFVGAGNKEAGIDAPHHHPRFDIDESSMIYAARLLIGLALDYMNEHA
ncbi:M20 family metallopeptidase [Paenibacillus sp. MBLB4367]|uniref:M20 metallopeptidase family protein n=1 Tax=Paenibacillus sp. MBLB4367 TaxID=3384767 RepID=UPI0039081ADA